LKCDGTCGRSRALIRGIKWLYYVGRIDPSYI
jgi:hypothetical protein